MYCYNCMKKLNEGQTYCYDCAKKSAPDNIPHHLAAGTVLNGKYLVGNAIGEGGFGITYVGRDLTLDIRIAIKEFYPNGYANRNNSVSNKVILNYTNKGEYFKQGMDKFLFEAQNIAKFSSERAIVDVRDYFTENDTAYIIMEYVDGITLKNKIERDGLFVPEEAFRLMIPIMNSLHKMHTQHILHRDISPDNIMLLKDGTLKLMDFGSARYFSEQGSKTMSVMLKPGYAPYEQYNTNGNQGPWTDVYGLCATIYKCITGEVPVDSLDRCRTDKLLKPSQLGVKITPSLENVLMYGLAIYPENRCRSMKELMDISQKAFLNSSFAVSGRKPNVVAGQINNTKKIDEQYKTMFADGGGDTSDYSDNFNTFYDNSSQPQVPNPPVMQSQPMRQNQPAPQNRPVNQGQPPQNYNRPGYNQPMGYPPRNPQKKSNGGIIALIITLSVLLIAGIGVCVFFLLNSDSDSGKNSSSSSKSDTSATETEDKTVKMPDVKGMDYEEAESKLEALGLKPKIMLYANAEVPEGEVIDQGYNIDDELEKGQEVDLFVSVGKNGQKVEIVAAPGESEATLTMYNLDNGEWQEIMSCRAVVGDGGISKTYGEGYTYTPEGKFPINTLLCGEGAEIDTGLRVKKVGKYVVIDSDPESEDYNTIVNCENENNLRETDDLIGYKLNGYDDSMDNNALIFIEQNGDGFTKNGANKEDGSAITICGCKQALRRSTEGCIDISADNMVTLAKALDRNKRPCVILRTE